MNIKQILYTLKRSRLGKIIRPTHTEEEEGQSLVEFAIILPLVLLMLLGVFEVGWVLRGYLTMANANRESARFASRGVYLNFDEKQDAGNVGYSKVVTHTMDSLSSQLTNMNFLQNNTGSNSSLIITYYSIEPGTFSCPGDPTCDNFDCDQFLDPTFDGTAIQADYDLDDINDIEYPILYAPPPYDDGSFDLPDFYESRVPQDTSGGLVDHFEAITSYHYHTGGPYFSRINPVDKIAELRGETNKLNCELSKKGLPESNMEVVVVENTFAQDQLVGFPFVTAFIPNPIPLYSQTTMRINPAARQETNEEAFTCSLYPIMIPSSKVSGMRYGEDVTIPVDSHDHDVPGNFGFIQWDYTVNSGTANQQEGTVTDNLANPGNAATAYKEPSPPDLDGDTQLSVGDWIAAVPGARASLDDDIEPLVGTQMIFPVWNDADCLGGGACINAPGSGNTAMYRTYTFVRMILTEVNMKGNNCGSPGQKCLKFRFEALDPNVCVETQDES